MDEQATKTELSKLLEAFSTWYDERRAAEEARSKVTASLHQHTDMASLIGMVKNQELWLTNTSHLNDPSELIHGQNLANKCFWEIIADPPCDNAESFCGVMSDRLAEAYETTFSLFVASFSRTADDLAQWRAYADDGRGVAIEIAPEWFQPDHNKPSWQAGTSDPREYYAVSDVVYNDDEAARRQREAIEKAVGLVTEATTRRLLDDGPLCNWFMAQLRASLGVPLIWNCLTTKHEAYAHEAETRLLLTHQIGRLAPHVRSRARGSQIVSYVPIQFPLSRPGVLKRIWIGPAAIGAIGAPERGVADLLRANNINPDGLIVRSPIPYRPR